MRRRFSTVLAAMALVGATQAWAVKTSLWTQDTVDDFLSGDVTGVTVTSEGQVQLGAAWDSVVTNLPEVAQIWCLARDSKGQIYFGTGDDGRIYRWSHGHQPQLVWNTGSSEIMSLVIDEIRKIREGQVREEELDTIKKNLIDQLTEPVRWTQCVQAMIGDGEKRVLPIEEPARQYARRSLYAKRDIFQGHVMKSI